MRWLLLIGFTLVRGYTTVAPHLEMDPTLFAPGSRYVFAINASLGVPGAGMGDFRTDSDATLPAGFSNRNSGTFTIAPM